MSHGQVPRKNFPTYVFSSFLGGIQLSITEETVKGRVKNILSKLGANDRAQAAMIGLKRGIIEL